MGRVWSWRSGIKSCILRDRWIVDRSFSVAHFGEDSKPEKYVPPVLILCGGKGERLGGLANGVPKPMVELGGKPILWHIMKHFSYYGFKDFVLALGFMGWVVDYYFKDRQSFPEEWKVKCIPTGWDTSNGT